MEVAVKTQMLEISAGLLGVKYLSCLSHLHSSYSQLHIFNCGRC